MLARTQSKIITITPLLTADSIAASLAYSDKDVIGNHSELQNAVASSGGTGVVQSIVLRSKEVITVAFDIILLHTEPAAAYGANNSALALADTDLMKVLGIIRLATTDISAINSLSSVATKANVGLPIRAIAGSRSIWAIVVAGGAATFALAGDLEIDVGILQD